MKTIGAKELRLHMDEVLDRVLQGEEIVVKHRFKAPVRMVAMESRQPSPNSGTVIGKKLDALMPELRKHRSALDPNRSYKELYAESLRADPKYGKYFK